MLRITPSPSQRAAIEEARLEGLARVMEQSAQHEDLRTARARRFKAIRQGGEFISFQNTLIDTMNLLIKTEPRVRTKVEEKIERLHLTAKISEVCPVLASR